jgi:hypothetical protein
MTPLQFLDDLLTLVLGVCCVMVLIKCVATAFADWAKENDDD